MDCEIPGFPVLYCLQEFAQTHINWVSDAIPRAHPLSRPLLLPSIIPQYQDLFHWVSSSHQATKVLELQHQFFQWIVRADFLQDCLVWSPCCPRDSSRVSSSTTVWKYKFFGTQPSLWSNSHIHLVTQMVKNLPPMWEIRVWSLGQEDLLEKGMETYSSILAWRIPWTEEPGGLQSTRSQRVRHDWSTNTHTLTSIHDY